MAGQILNPGAFPPGSSAVFIDLINRLARLLDNTGSTAEGAQQAAQAAQQTANSAQQTASGAQTTANAAQNTANAANDAAFDAQTAANFAQSTADDVQTDFNTNGVRKDVTTLQIMQGPLSVGTELRISNIKVLGGRITGWTASTGTAVKGGFDADQTYPIGATYSQSELQALADGLVELRKVVLALQQGATSHGLIGS